VSAVTLSSIKTAIATTLGNYAGLRTFPYQPDTINPPFAWPTLQKVEYHTAMSGGLSTYTFSITVVVSRSTDRYPEKALDGYLDYSSGIRSVLEADPSLGGVVSASVVESAGAITSMDAGDTMYLSIDFSMTVYA